MSATAAIASPPTVPGHRGWYSPPEDLLEEEASNSPRSAPEVLGRRRPHIVLAEDDLEMCVMLSLLLRQRGYEVTECGDGHELLDQLSGALLDGGTPPIDLVISDIRMPGISGLTIFEGVRQCEGIPPLIAITAFGDEETHERARRAGVVAMFDKPFEVDDFLATVRRLVPPQPVW